MTYIKAAIDAAKWPAIDPISVAWAFGFEAGYETYHALPLSEFKTHALCNAYFGDPKANGPIVDSFFQGFSVGKEVRTKELENVDQEES
jgi:hypothetical protein